MDAWETLTANATDTTDAWSALGSQQTTGGIPGKAVDEIRFTIDPPVEVAISVSPVSVAIAHQEVVVSANAQVKTINVTQGES